MGVPPAGQEPGAGGREPAVHLIQAPPGPYCGDRGSEEAEAASRAVLSTRAVSSGRFQ